MDPSFLMWFYHSPPLPSGRPLLAAHRPPRQHPCSCPSSAWSRHCRQPTLSSQHYPVSPLCHPHCSSCCRRPHCHVVLLRYRRVVHHPHCQHCLECQRGGRCPHNPHCPIVQEGSRNLQLYIHYSIWIVNCGGVHLA
jgi:hypothetical protein